jgi:endonuclease-8
LEGPSLYLAAEWLAPLIGKIILGVEGNTKIGKERLNGKTILDIFSWGKHLVLQFDDFALRVHFMLYGSFEATINDKKVTGDYPKKKASPRLVLTLEEGQMTLYSCSLKYLETSHARELYDFSTDIMSFQWNSIKALTALKNHQDDEIADVLLDQSIFSGVGNIIKNEVLFLVKKQPSVLVKDMSHSLLQKTVKTTKKFSFQFYEWRKQFILKKHYKISFFCPKCQK